MFYRGNRMRVRQCIQEHDQINVDPSDALRSHYDVLRGMRKANDARPVVGEQRLMILRTL